MAISSLRSASGDVLLTTFRPTHGDAMVISFSPKQLYRFDDREYSRLPPQLSDVNFLPPPEPSVTASMIVKIDDFRLNSSMTISFSSNQAFARIQPVKFFRPEYNLEIVVQQKLTLLASPSNSNGVSDVGNIVPRTQVRLNFNVAGKPYPGISNQLFVLPDDECLFDACKESRNGQW
jgi:hypothetical protein